MTVMFYNFPNSASNPIRIELEINFSYAGTFLAKNQLHRPYCVGEVLSPLTLPISVDTISRCYLVSRYYLSLLTLPISTDTIYSPIAVISTYELYFNIKGTFYILF